MVPRAFLVAMIVARAVVARAFLVAVVVTGAVVARAFLVAVIVGLEQWLLEHSWWLFERLGVKQSEMYTEGGGGGGGTLGFPPWAAEFPQPWDISHSIKKLS